MAKVADLLEELRKELVIEDLEGKSMVEMAEYARNMRDNKIRIREEIDSLLLVFPLRT